MIARRVRGVRVALLAEAAEPELPAPAVGGELRQLVDHVGRQAGNLLVLVVLVVELEVGNAGF